MFGGTDIGDHAHLGFRERHGPVGYARLTAFEKLPAKQWKFLNHDSVLANERHIGAHAEGGSSAVGGNALE